MENQKKNNSSIIRTHGLYISGRETRLHRAVPYCITLIAAAAATGSAAGSAA